MKLHDLTVGQRFTFTDKHRGKVFEVTGKGSSHIIEYKDIATGEYRNTISNRKTFRMEVELVTDNRTVILDDDDIGLLTFILLRAYNDTEPYAEYARSKINKLFLKITGSAGRRVVLPEGEPTLTEFPADRKGGVS